MIYSHAPLVTRARKALIDDGGDDDDDDDDECECECVFLVPVLPSSRAAHLGAPAGAPRGK